MEKELVEKLLEIVKVNEWQTHPSGYSYCPYCRNGNDGWLDQQKHHEGCEFVAVVAEAENYLAG